MNQISLCYVYHRWSLGCLTLDLCHSLVVSTSTRIVNYFALMQCVIVRDPYEFVGMDATINLFGTASAAIL